MTDPDRYATSYYDGNTVIEKDTDGEWIRWEDYVRKRDGWKRVHDSMRSEIEAWERIARSLGYKGPILEQASPAKVRGKLRPVITVEGARALLAPLLEFDPPSPQPVRQCLTCKNFEADQTCYVMKQPVVPHAYCSVYNPLNGPLPKGPGGDL